MHTQQTMEECGVNETNGRADREPLPKELPCQGSAVASKIEVARR